MNPVDKKPDVPKVSRQELADTITLARQNLGVKEITPDSAARVAMNVFDSLQSREREYAHRRVEVFLFDIQRAFEEVRVAKRPVSMGYLQSLNLKCGWGVIDKFLRDHPDIKRSIHKNKVYFTYIGRSDYNLRGEIT